MKAKQFQIISMSCGSSSILSKEHCSSASEFFHPLLLWYFPHVLFLWWKSFPLNSLLFPILLCAFSTFWCPTEPYFISHVASLASWGFIFEKRKKTCSFLMWFCFNTELLWLFFSLLFAVFSTIAELWLIFFFPQWETDKKPRNSLERHRSMWI